jgi:1,4-dihydroxy-2-naphthoate octaprenyltransferase
VLLPLHLLCFLLCACLVVAWLNLSNDAWDAETSVDVAKAESAVRLLGSPRPVHQLAAACLLLGAGGLAWLALRCCGGAGALSLALLCLSLLCGVLYQAPPFRWSYLGRGEPLCFLAFGPLATTAFSLAAQGASGAAGPPPPCALAASLLVGCSTTAILFCSHFHQLATDEAAGKRSPIVRMGTQRAAHALSRGVTITLSAAVAACWVGWLPLPVAAAALLCAPLAKAMLQFVEDYHDAPERVFSAKFRAVRWHAAQGAALALAFALARIL